MDKLKVSVCMIVYNHENFIEEAINSILSQTTNFDIEFIISNDNSTDKSNEVILQTIQESDVIKIRYFNHNKNLGMMPNFLFSLEKCSGKYIALCDGDDYWTDPFKLQKQVDFLESNPDYAICFHNVKIYNQINQELIGDTLTRVVDETVDVVELAKGNFIHTPSVILRNDFEIPDWVIKSPIGDWTLYMIAIKDRKIKKMEEIMAVYRVHELSVWSNLPYEVRVEKTKVSINLISQYVKLPLQAKKILEGRCPIVKKKKSPFWKKYLYE